MTAPPPFDAYAEAEVYGLLLVFARVGAAVMLLPGFGELWVAPRIRLSIALALSLVVYALMHAPGAAAPSFGAAIVAVAGETFAGLLFGASARLFLAAPVVAGQIMGQTTALSNIFVSPASGMEAGSIYSVWLVLGAIAFIFVSDLHLLMIDAMVATYGLFPQGGIPHLGDAAKTFSELFSGVFRLGVQMAAPFLILGFAFNLGIGLVNKMMLSMPVFFIAMPLSILGGFLILAETSAAIFAAFQGALLVWLERPFP